MILTSKQEYYWKKVFCLKVAVDFSLPLAYFTGGSTKIGSYVFHLSFCPLFLFPQPLQPLALSASTYLEGGKTKR